MILVEHLPGGGVAVQQDVEGAGTEADTCAYETLAVRDPPPTPRGAEQTPARKAINGENDFFEKLSL